MRIDSICGNLGMKIVAIAIAGRITSMRFHCPCHACMITWLSWQPICLIVHVSICACILTCTIHVLAESPMSASIISAEMSSMLWRIRPCMHVHGFHLAFNAHGHGLAGSPTNLCSCCSCVSLHAARAMHVFIPCVCALVSQQLSLSALGTSV